VLVLAPARAFFMLYQTVARTALEARQLDLGTATAAAGSAAPPEQAVRKAVEAAAGGQACVLATHAQLSLQGFPVAMFQVCTCC
jgi:hypothetical protein